MKGFAIRISSAKQLGLSLGPSACRRCVPAIEMTGVYFCSQNTARCLVRVAGNSWTNSSILPSCRVGELGQTVIRVAQWVWVKEHLIACLNKNN